MTHALLKRPRPVRRRSDPDQIALKQKLQSLSDRELASLEADILAFIRQGHVTPALSELMGASGAEQVRAA